MDQSKAIHNAKTEPLQNSVKTAQPTQIPDVIQVHHFTMKPTTHLLLLKKSTRDVLHLSQKNIPIVKLSKTSLARAISTMT